jgi:glucuronide carrier protein
VATISKKWFRVRDAYGVDVAAGEDTLVIGIGMGGVNTLMWALEADTVEYGEWKTGIRTEGITYALFSFTRKMGQVIGGAAAAYTIGIGGYIADSRSNAQIATV